jgi:glutaredoxin
MSRHYFLIIGLCLVCHSIQAEIYKWIDKSGRLHYSDVPSETTRSEKLDLKINSIDSVSYSQSAAAITTNKVVMYSTSWCGYCKKARKYFIAKGIDFIDYDIEKNARAKHEYDALGARGVPVILVGKERMNGFSAGGFDRLYAKAQMQ